MVFAFLAFALPSIAQLQLGAAWPKYRGDRGNTGQAIGVGALPILKWNIPIEEIGNDSYRFRAVGSDGTLYVQVNGGIAACDGQTGTQKWSNHVGGYTFAINKNNTLYACDYYSFSLTAPNGATENRRYNPISLPTAPYLAPPRVSETRGGERCGALAFQTGIAFDC